MGQIINILGLGHVFAGYLRSLLHNFLFLLPSIPPSFPFSFFLQTLKKRKSHSQLDLLLAVACQSLALESLLSAVIFRGQCFLKMCCLRASTELWVRAVQHGRWACH